MAKSQNNLNAVFTDTANAIREKRGIEETFTPRDFADYLDAINTCDTYIKLVKNMDDSSTDYTRTCIRNGKEVAFDIGDYNFLNPTEVTLNSGDVMMKVSAFYYSRTIANNIETIYVSDTGLKDIPVDLHPAFVRLDTNGNVVRLPYIYIAKYLSSTVNSVISSVESGNINGTWKTMANWRTAIEAKGVGWRQFDLFTHSLFCLMFVSKYGSTLHTNYLDDFGFSYFTGHWVFCDGCSVASGVLSLAKDDSDYATYANYKATPITIPKSGYSKIVKTLAYDYQQPWIFIPKTVASNDTRGQYYDGRIYAAGSANQTTITIGGHSSNTSDFNESSVFSYVWNDGKMIEAGSNYYHTRMIYIPFEGNTEEPITSANYKTMFGATVNGNNTTGYKQYTTATETTYKYYNGNTLVKTETINENNTLTYWLHIPFNYKANVSYPIYTYLHGSGGCLYLQTNENGGSSYNRLNMSAFADNPSYAMRLLSGAARSGAGHTGYIDAIIKPQDETMYSSSAFGGSWDASFPTAWLTWVKDHPEDDGFFIFPELNDELWFEDRAEYTKENQTCVLLDINNSYSKGFGEKISNKSYGHTYLVSQLSPNPWYQCLVKLQDDLMATYNIDKTKNYVIGASLGGVGTMDLISHYPTRFSHAVPCCMASCDLSTTNLTNIKDVKIRSYYGNSDSWVAAGEFGDELVSRFTALGGEAENIGWAMGHATTALSADFTNIMRFLKNQTLFKHEITYSDTTFGNNTNCTMTIISSDDSNLVTTTTTVEIATSIISASTAQRTYAFDSGTPTTVTFDADPTVTQNLTQASGGKIGFTLTGTASGNSTTLNLDNMFITADVVSDYNE